MFHHIPRYCYLPARSNYTCWYCRDSGQLRLLAHHLWCAATKRFYSWSNKYLLWKPSIGSALYKILVSFMFSVLFSRMPQARHRMKLEVSNIVLERCHGRFHPISFCRKRVVTGTRKETSSPAWYANKAEVTAFVVKTCQAKWAQQILKARNPGETGTLHVYMYVT